MGIPIWTRAVADPAFRDALIDDPLRALADAGDVNASPEQVAQLEEMDPEDRREMVLGVVREVHMKGGAGPLRVDRAGRPARRPAPRGGLSRA